MTITINAISESMYNNLPREDIYLTHAWDVKHQGFSKLTPHMYTFRTKYPLLILKKNSLPGYATLCDYEPLTGQVRFVNLVMYQTGHVFFDTVKILSVDRKRLQSSMYLNTYDKFGKVCKQLIL